MRPKLSVSLLLLASTAALAFLGHARVRVQGMNLDTAAAAFAGSDDAAFLDGDFAMLENELQPVLQAMRKQGINIVAIHQHMSHEQPRYFFLHYWGKGKGVDLAQSLRRVLDAPAQVKS